MTRMHNLPPPGEVLKACLGDKTVTEAAAQLGVSRATRSAMVLGASGVSPGYGGSAGQCLGDQSGAVGRPAAAARLAPIKPARDHQPGRASHRGGWTR